MAAAADIELEAAHIGVQLLKRQGNPDIGGRIIRIVVVRIICGRVAIVGVFDLGIVVVRVLNLRVVVVGILDLRVIVVRVLDL
ncbi:hypothetical protein D3C80_1294830 [compost metagenome]